MLRARLLLMGVVLIVLLIPGSRVVGQETLTETFTASDGSYSLRYPAGWVYEVDPEGLILANSVSALAQYGAPTIPPQSGTVFVVKLDHLTGLDLSRLDVEGPLTPGAVADALLAGWLNMADVEVASEPRVMELGDHSAACFGLADTAGQTEVLIVVTAVDARNHVFMAMVPRGELAAAEPTILSIVGSLEVAPIVVSTPAPQHILRPGTLVRADLLQPQGDRWYFDGEAGQKVSIMMVGNFDTVLELRSPDGALVAQNDDTDVSFSSLIEDFGLPVTGQYCVVARAFSAGSGPYILVLGIQPNETEARLTAVGQTDAEIVTEMPSESTIPLTGG